MKTKSTVFLLITTIISALPFTGAFAQGTHDGGGGDPCETRIDIIRRDLIKWIKEGHASALNLQYEFTPAEYEQKMLSLLDEGRVQLSCKKESKQALAIKEIQKTCLNFKDASGAFLKIECDFDRFMDPKITSAERYSLIHHEYASLAGIERNYGAKSDYFVSEQIAAYLEPSIEVLGNKSHPEKTLNFSQSSAIGNNLDHKTSSSKTYTFRILVDTLEGIRAFKLKLTYFYLKGRGLEVSIDSVTSTLQEKYSYSFGLSSSGIFKDPLNPAGTFTLTMNLSGASASYSLTQNIYADSAGNISLD